MTSPWPIDAYRCVRVAQRERLRRRVSSAASSGLTSRRRFSSRSRISCPSFTDDDCSSWRSHCRILCRARPVRTCASQSRLGRAVGEVMISTVSELRSGRDSGAMRPLTFAPAQCSPTSRVHGEGEVDRRRALGQLDDVALRREDEDLVGVEIELEELEELVRRLRVELQLENLAEPGEVPVELVGSSSRPPCTASAPRCRSPRCGASSRVRIWISYSCRPGPNTVVCSDW